MNLNRRDFLGGFAAAAGLAAVGGCKCPFCGCGAARYAAQLYSIHKIFWQKPEWCLEGLRKAGFDGTAQRGKLPHAFQRLQLGRQRRV